MPPQVRVARRALRSWRTGEPELRLLPRLCSRRLHSLDVGANNGVYTWHLARWSAGVTAFEPQPEHAAILSRAFGRRVAVERVALSDSEGEAVLRVPLAALQDGLATIEPRNALGGGAVRDYAVPRRRLDGYDLPPVGVVKIDVEGHELAVLQGAAALLARDRPHLLVEAEERHCPGTLASVAGFLSRFGYRPNVLRNGELLPLDADLRPSAGGPAGAVNFVFLARPIAA